MNRTPVENAHAPRILIVDNDDRIVELVSWFLSKKGFAVTSAASFAETRELLAEGRPDLMLSDVDLGSESALEELPRLFQEGLLPPTLVVSGYLDPQTAGSLESLEPVMGTLAKPFDFPQLEDRIESCLRSLRSPDSLRSSERAANPMGGILQPQAPAHTPQVGTQPGSPVGVDPLPVASAVTAADAAGGESSSDWIEILPAGN